MGCAATRRKSSPAPSNLPRPELMPPVESVRLSKLLSLVLRHQPAEFGVTLNPAGWVEVDALLAGLSARGHSLTWDQLDRVVADNDGVCLVEHVPPHRLSLS